MTFNNSILLILKQNNPIDFQELLSKISSRYKNKNSAYSALKRALKNLESFGQIKIKNSFIYITDKGLASIQIEMKEKLVLKLNDALKNPIDNIEEIVQLLIVFTERAHESNDLLQNAKENALFTINDLSEIQEKIEEKKEILDKMASLIGVQEERLRELDFNDSIEMNFDEKFVKKALKILENEKLLLEVWDKDFSEEFSVWEKNGLIIIEKEFANKAFEILLKNPLNEFIIYLPKIKCLSSKGKIKLFGSFKSLKEFR